MAHRINSFTIKNPAYHDILFFCSLANELLSRATERNEISWSCHQPLPGCYSCNWMRREILMDVSNGRLVSVNYGDVVVEFCFDVFDEKDTLCIQKLRDEIYRQEELIKTKPQ